MKVGIIDVGGGLRDIFGAGIFDYLLDNNIEIPVLLGISAGSANAINYISKQRGRSRRFYMDYDHRKEAMSLRNLITKKVYLDLDYLYTSISLEGGEDPFDYDTFAKSKKKLIVVTTRAKDGRPKYFTNKDVKKSDYSVLSASSCLPIMCKPITIDNEVLFDGSISAPIPVEKLWAEKVDKIIIILTRPIDYRKDDGKKKLLYKRLKKKYPEFTEVLLKRCETYNKKLDSILKENNKNILILAPNSTKGLSTLSKDKEKLFKLYEEGYEKGKILKDFIS